MYCYGLCRWGRFVELFEIVKEISAWRENPWMVHTDMSWNEACPWLKNSSLRFKESEYIFDENTLDQAWWFWDCQSIGTYKRHC